MLPIAGSLVAAMLLGAPLPALARTVIIKSIGPVAARYPRGMVLPDRVRIQLGRLDAITLLDDEGTRAFRGPIAITMPLPRNRYRARPVLAGFLRALSPSEVLSVLDRAPAPAPASGRRSRLGARRAAPSNIPAPAPAPALAPTPAGSLANLWLIDPQQSGTFCLPAADAATILDRWPGRPLHVAPVDGAPSIETIGAVGGIGWPVAAVPIVNGHSYALGDGGARRAVVRLVVLDGLGMEPAPAEVALKLASAGCDLQLERLAADAPINGPE
ncbi:hypothetical protein NX02_14160 [Sphingomonas sanxanigenens DSM 19645 = NX02]|uniref:Uncharacterized protein n=2 Tax=Sphingomonas sanxanigenens TaxID=397260 RepID=W0A9D9_9SPHN|nr:hypothetical protein NX02_14160 [Sphingomonas sanxanigenens DSM 19645 = NX02]